MLTAGILAMAAILAGADQAAAQASEKPRSLDDRLVLERIASEHDIVTPIGVAVDHKGRVLVIESHTHSRPENYPGPRADRVVIFEDANRDGIPERTGIFFEGTEQTMGLAVARDGSVFLATRRAVFHLFDRDGDGRADLGPDGKTPAAIVRLETPGNYPHNGLAGFAFDATDGVYFGLGENLGAAYRLVGSDGSAHSGGGEGGNIYRCRQDGSKLEKIATGFWNPFHLGFDAFGRLFAVDNDPDSRPPCRLLHIVSGGDYGYRFRNGRKGVHPFTAWNGEIPGTLPMLAGTGEAPSGVLSYESDNLPEDYIGNILVTSWGDHRIERYRLRARGASFQSKLEPLVVGGDNFRPVGIATGIDGSLYITDWVKKDYEVHGKGALWRLRAKKSSRITDAGVLSADAARRDAALAEEPAAVERLASESTNVRTRAAAIGMIARTSGIRGVLAAKLIEDPSPDVRSLLVNLSPADAINLTKIAQDDPSLLVRAEAMRRLSDPSSADLLLKVLESDDPFMTQAARDGLKHTKPVMEWVKAIKSGGLSANRRLGLILIVRESANAETRSLLPALLSDADPRIRFAAIQWIGEEKLEAYRPNLIEVLSSGMTTRDLFAATLASLERLDGKTRGPKQEVSGDDYIATLLADPKTPPEVIGQGLRMLRTDHPVLTLDLFKRFLSSSDPLVKLETIRSLRESPLPERFNLLGGIVDDVKEPSNIRAEAIVGLAWDTSKSRDRLITLAGSREPILRREALRALRGVSLKPGELESLTQASLGDSESIALLELLKGFPDQAATPPADLEAWLARLEGPADAAAGARVFFQPKGPGCVRCHQVDDRGGRVGPNLSTADTGRMEKRRLVQSILEPSKEIAPQFVTWAVARTDGTVFTGVLVNESPLGDTTFADPEGRLINIKTTDIAERKPIAKSLMPDRLSLSMTIQEFRDLVAFLTQPKSSAQPSANAHP